MRLDTLKSLCIFPTSLYVVFNEKMIIFLISSKDGFVMFIVALNLAIFYFKPIIGSTGGFTSYYATGYSFGYF